jgi:hypothetical protein
MIVFYNVQITNLTFVGIVSYIVVALRILVSDT